MEHTLFLDGEAGMTVSICLLTEPLNKLIDNAMENQKILFPIRARLSQNEGL